MTTTTVERTTLGSDLLAPLADVALPWLPMMLALGLYLFGLGDAPLWYDEAGSVWMAELTLPRLVAATAGDTHPPLYFILLAGVQRLLGSTPVAMRLLSVVFALLAIAITVEIGRALKLPPLAQIAGAGLIVISPFQLHFAQEARMYSLLQYEVLLVLLSTLRREWFMFALASAAALWTHNYALIYLPVMAFVGLLREAQEPAGGPDPCRLDRWFMACAVPVVLYLPWGLVLISQMQEIASGYHWIQPLTPGSVIHVLYLWLFGFTLPEWMQPSGVLLAAGLVAWLIVTVLRRGDGPAWALAWCAFAPVLLVVAASVLWKPILLFRGFAPSVPLLFLLAGWAFARLSPGRLVYALGVVTPLLLTALAGHYVWNPDHKTGAQQYAADIRAQWQTGDILLHANEGTLMELHNLTGDLPQYLLPRCAQPNLGGLSNSTRAALGMQAADPSSLRWTRAWFVWSWPPTVTQCEVDQALAFLRKYPARLMFPIRDDDYVYAAVWLIER